MSKENTNLRLLGSPVNFSHRSKKNNDKKNIRNRPRSALQNSCFTPENPDSFKRPFSADTNRKEQVPSARSFFKTFSAELLQTYRTPTIVKVLPPTTDILNNSKLSEGHPVKNKEICSNASDYGSEDTHISLGTKIKARAQSGPKTKTNLNKNFLKYKNLPKKGRKVMDVNNEDKSNEFGLQVKISERPRSQSPPRKNVFERSYSPSYKNHSYESYFLPLETDPRNDTSLIGRVSFGTDDIDCEVNNAIETYSRRLALTKQQLSLVEEESTQDLESVPSQNLSSLSPENSLEVPKDVKNDNAGDFTGRDTYVMNTNETYPEVSESFFNQTKTYNNFYDDLRSSNGQFKNKMSSTAVHTDSSSKDSGYHDNGGNDEKSYVHDYSLPTTTSIKDFDTRKKLNSEMESASNSLDSASNSNDKAKNYQLDKKCNWMEPLNHSRLLYKDFFLKKEGHIPIAPQNSPIRSDIHTLNISEPKKHSDGNENPEYPSYLRNCTTKAYTSRVIEDYKKELEAINCLHELTLKDIKIDAISPTPLNINKMFEEKSNSNQNESHEVIGDAAKNNNLLDCNKRADISKVSTKELIQKYLKVKGGDYCHDEFCKSLKKLDKKTSHADSQGLNKNLNNTNKFVPTKSNLPVNVKNQTRRNIFTATTPLSARIERVQNDKDVDSWMSLSSPSPRNIEIETSPYPIEEAVETKSSEESDKVEIPVEPSMRDSKVEAYPKANDVKETPKELNSKSTVLDIYSMLKEIESFADNPVKEVSSNQVENLQPKSEQEEMSITPKDNFMEIFEFLEKVEQSANDALSVVTNTTPHTTPKLETLLKLPQTELAQRLVTASLQLEERSCCIALLQESLTNNKEQMINKVSNLEKQSHRNVAKVKLECEEAIKRHQSFIDQLINDKKTLNHRIEQLVSERRSLEEKWERSAQALEERYKLELRNQRDKMAAAQQVARQRWVRQKAEKIKELTVKGLEGELREMAERQQKEVADLKMSHAEQFGRIQTKHAAELEDLRRKMEEEKEAALVKERQMASARLEKQILELESSYQEQRSRLVAEMRAENERAAAALAHRETATRGDIEKWREAQEKILQAKKLQMEQDMLKEREKLEEEMKQKNLDIEKKFEQYKKDFEMEQAVAFKKKVTEISAQHKQERDKEIEKAIDTLEAEAHSGRRELQEAMKRNKEQYEVELKELGETRQATLRRYQEAQARVRQTEDKCAELEVVIGQLETRNKVLIDKNTQLENQLEDVRKSCESSWQEKLDNAKKEIEDSRRTHEEQMHQLYAKVKVAVARKDSAIQALTRETAKYQEKITMLEQKLQQQRKDFLKHK